MSYGQKFKGKLVWGSPVWRILLEPEGMDLATDFTGALTLFERRHEKSRHNYDSLADFVEITRTLWIESLRIDDIQDTRLSRWIEELFSELNVPGTYDEILAAVRGESFDATDIQMGESQLLSQEQITEMIPSTEDILPSGINQRLTGDLSNKEEVYRLLESVLHQNKPERKKFATSKASYKTPDGTERLLETKKPIEDPPLDDTPLLKSGFNNDFEIPVEDVQFSDIIPYDYKIQDIKISGVEPEKIGETKTEDGIQVNWKLDKLDAGEKSQVEYELSNRMLRTVLIRDDADLTILQTYENINKSEDGDIWIDSKYVFKEKTAIVENVKLLDQIPGQYQLISSKPDIVSPIANMRSSSKTTEISWSYENVEVDTQFLVSYTLGRSQRILRDKLSLLDEDDRVVVSMVRILKQLKNNSGYGVIIAVEAHQPINYPINFTETIPMSYEIVIKESKFGSIGSYDDNEHKKVEWKFDSLPSNETKISYLQYLGTEKFTFKDLEIASKQEQIEFEEGKENAIRTEKIDFPDEYYSIVET